MSHIYVAHGTGRIIKIGRSKNVARRIHAVRKQLKLFGSDLIDWRVFAVPEIAAHACELSGIAAFSEFEPYSGREWFIGDFSLAVSMVEALIPARIAQAVELHKRHPPLTPEQVAIRAIENAARIAKKKADAIARRQKYNAAVAARRALREVRKAEMATRKSPTEAKEAAHG